ncbi:uroporphyrinogen-III synthase [Kerstersia sp.]|uniref:uroporphyrinogen-III synthase n=1 Tax=Kerstersia sp. TaxID=1930783 RepID=UPI003F8F9E45
MPVKALPPAARAGKPPALAVLTRPQGRNDALAIGLAEQGFEVVLLPALALVDADAATLAPDLADFDLLVFVSGAAVRAFRRLCAVQGRLTWPDGVWAAAVGPATAAAWDEPMAGPSAPPRWRIAPSAQAASHDSEHLLAAMDARGMQPRRVLLVRAGQGRDWLAERLRERGAQVRSFTAYQREPQPWNAAQREFMQAAAARQQQAFWLSTSGEGLAAVREQAQLAGILPWWRNSGHIVTHARLADRLAGEATGAVLQAMVKICLPLDTMIQRAFMALRTELD